jgi:hypothetical protein
MYGLIVQHKQGAFRMLHAHKRNLDCAQKGPTCRFHKHLVSKSSTRTSPRVQHGDGPGVAIMSRVAIDTNRPPVL